MEGEGVKKKRFDKEFKVSAVKMITEGGNKASEVARSLGIHPNQHYKRNGTCVVLMAVEPLAGRRIVKVTEQRTKNDYAQFMKSLAAKYPDAEKIVLVQDNLNTHNPSSFYETFDATEAFALSQRFEMVYTPKKASWLNMAEIELSALSKQCLDRRIDKRAVLSKEVSAWTMKRDRLKTKITWHFTKSIAREKFNDAYNTIKN